MKANVQFQNPDSVEVTVTMTMSVADWRRLSAQLPLSEFPAWHVALVIRRLTQAAEFKASETLEVEL